jgi:SAM-dependent methyltransferase
MPETSEEVLLRFRGMPEYREQILQAYLDEDPLDACDRFFRSEEFAVLRAWASKRGVVRGRVLDLGAGTGFSSCAFARAGYEVVALEPDRSDVVGLGAMRSGAERAGVRLRMCAGIAESVPFREGCFDLVYCRAVLHHVRDLSRTCRDVHRVLRPGGLFLATREHVVSRTEDVEVFREQHQTHRFTGAENAYREDEYVGTLRTAGFQVLDVVRSYDSVVNYFPMTTSDLQRTFREALAGRVGRRGAEALSTLQPLQRRYGHRLSRRDDTPGRLYTFVCRKPGP